MTIHNYQTKHRQLLDKVKVLSICYFHKNVCVCVLANTKCFQLGVSTY